MVLDGPQRPRYLEAVVRDIAAGTGFTTVGFIGETAEAAFAITCSFRPDQVGERDYGLVLHAAAEMERRHPTTNPISACCLVLPERDIAYLHDPQANPPLRALTVGPNPYDDPETANEVRDGLADLMGAIQQAQRAARAFQNRPTGERSGQQQPPGPTRPTHERRNQRGPHR